MDKQTTRLGAEAIQACSHAIIASTAIVAVKEKMPKLPTKNLAMTPSLLLKLSSRVPQVSEPQEYDKHSNSQSLSCLQTQASGGTTPTREMPNMSLLHTSSHLLTHIK